MNKKVANLIFFTLFKSKKVGNSLVSDEKVARLTVSNEKVVNSKLPNKKLTNCIVSKGSGKLGYFERKSS